MKVPPISWIWRARTRLYRSRCLQRDTHPAATFEIYKMCLLLCLFKLKRNDIFRHKCVFHQPSPNSIDGCQILGKLLATVGKSLGLYTHTTYLTCLSWRMSYWAIIASNSLDATLLINSRMLKQLIFPTVPLSEMKTRGMREEMVSLISSSRESAVEHSRRAKSSWVVVAKSGRRRVLRRFGNGIARESETLRWPPTADESQGFAPHYGASRRSLTGIFPMFF